MDAPELARWTRFASKGGIGRGTATMDCVAEDEEDLMFLKDDEITVLMQLEKPEDAYLGYCEGVVGRFRGSCVQFHGKLKRPVMTKRSSSSTGVGRSSLSAKSPSPRPPSSTLLAPSPDTSEVASLRALAKSISPPPSGSPSRTFFPLPEVDRSPRVASRLAEAQNATLSPIISEDSPAATPSMSVASTFSDPELATPRPEETSFMAVPHYDAHPPVDEDDIPNVKVVDDREPDEPEEDSFRPDPSPRLRADSSATFGDVGDTRASVVSAAMSDGEFGIGLSLLQDMMASDSRSSYASSRRDTVTTASTTSSAHVSPTRPLHIRPAASASAAAEPSYVSTSLSTSPTNLMNPPEPDPDSDSPLEPPQRSGTAMSSASASASADDWDGHSIFDAYYRQSRFSMASKMSRLSLSSTYTLGQDAPPLPLADSARPSFDRSWSGDVRRAAGPSTPPAQADTAASPTAGRQRGRVPAALDVARAQARPEMLEAHHSPLLHTSFGSPMESAFSPTSMADSSSSGDARGSASSADLASRSSFPINASASGGIVGALRQRMEGESERHSPLANQITFDVHRRQDTADTARPIVIEDDEPVPEVTVETPEASPKPDDRRLSDSSASEYTHESAGPDETPLARALLPRIQVDTTAQDSFSESRTPDEYTPSASPYPLSILSTPVTPSATSPLPSAPASPTTSSSPTEPIPTSMPASPGAFAPVPPSSSPSTPSSPYFTASRTSLFLPHPNAPKPPSASSGPLYGRKPPLAASPPPPGVHIPLGSIVHAVHLARGAMLQPLPNGAPRQATVYAHTAFDLAGAAGPVPVSFALEPQAAVPANRPPMQQGGFGGPQGAFGGQGQGEYGGPLAPQVGLGYGGPSGSQLPAGFGGPPPGHAQGGFGGSPAPPVLHVPPPPTTAPPAPSGSGHPPASLAGPSQNYMSPTPLANSQAPPPSDTRGPPPFNGAPGKVEEVSRPGSAQELKPPALQPAARRPRPRSRSFSGFDKPVLKELAEVDLSPKSGSSTPRSSTLPTPSSRPSSTSSTSGPGPRGPSHRAVSARAAIPKQSPLSLPQNNTVLGTSPAPEAMPPLTSSVDAEVAPRPGLRQVSSSIQLRGGPRSPPTSPSKLRPQPQRRSTSGSLPGSPASATGASFPQGNLFGHGSSNSLSSHDLTLGARMSTDTDASDARSLMSPPPLLRGSYSTSSPGHSRHGSVRSKLSISALRPKNGTGSIPPTPTDERSEHDVVQVKDTDFEMVTPMGIPRISTDVRRDSQDADSPGLDGKSDHLRPESPSTSTLSGRATSPVATASSPTASRKYSLESQQSAEVHRQRELKWIAAMTSIPPSQMRKSKKVKKLLLEGVPSSVRYVVWANLANVQARRMEGVYAKLCQRGSVPATPDIQRDVGQHFADDGALGTPDGPLVTVLQAYLTMVPDVRYHTGLALIAGYLLQQGPEEDAFWIFVSVMDTHLREYFATAPVRLEVDSALFSKLLEANDPALAKKLLVQLRLEPPAICTPWFTSIFARALPTEFMVRVWDILLCEGTVFLFRIGLAIAICCRQPLLKTKDQVSALTLLSELPSECLPESADAFISLAFSMKVKEDDIVKQRGKMETQLKKQTQQARPSRSRALSVGGKGFSVRRA